MKRLSGAESSALRATVDAAVRRRLEPELGFERALGLRCSDCDGELRSRTRGCARCRDRWENWARGRRGTVSPAVARRVIQLEGTSPNMTPLTALFAPERRMAWAPLDGEPGVAERQGFVVSSRPPWRRRSELRRPA